MGIGTKVFARVAMAATLLATAPAQAEVLTFHSQLDGQYGAAPTSSKATAKARIDVDTKRRLVSVDMTVDGISADALWDDLVAGPIGPVHLHKYATVEGGDSTLVLPLHRAGLPCHREGL